MLVSALDLYLKILCTARDCGCLSAGRAEPAEAVPALALAGFQADGVQPVLDALERFGGALLCDSPGLGKTRVALAVAVACSRRGASPLFVLPAGLVQTWRPLVESCGLPFRPLTHQALGHPSGTAAAGGARLVVVDEAHAFRNPATRGYRRLARLCSGRRVLLVTATPVNNQTEDLYHLLRLFAGDGAFACLGVPDLRAAFRSRRSRGPEATPGEASRALHDALRVLDAVMVRRTRANVLSPELELPAGLRFPERQLRELEPAPGHDGGPRLDALLAGLHRQAAAHPLLVSVLAKRLASSPVALARTLDRLCAWGRIRASLPSAGRASVLRRRLLETLDEEGGLQHLLPLEPAPELLLAKVVEPRGDSGGVPYSLQPTVYSLSAGEARAGKLQEWLEPMRAAARELARLPDGRALALERLLGSELAGVKTVVFSEYRDTALWLYRALARVPRRAFLDGRGGLTAAGRCSRADLLRRFAPGTHSGAEEGVPAEHERVRVLFATDVLSEGLNLQEAAAVVSFDLPWNPVRLIQRAGRIDRLGSPHASVQVFHVSPRPELERLLRLTERLLKKSGAIRATLGPAGEDRTLDGPCEEAGPSAGDASLSSSLRPRASSLSAGEARAVRDGGGVPESLPRTVLSADLGRFERLAPRALARAGRLPDGMLAASSCPSGQTRSGPVTLLACYLLDWRGAPGPALEWFQFEGGAVRPGALRQCSLLGLRAGLTSGPFARAEPGPPAGWRDLLEAAALRRLRGLASRATAGSGSIIPALRRLLAQVQRAERDCNTRPELLRSYEALERLLTSPLDAGLEERLRSAALSRPGVAELPALTQMLLSLPPARPDETQSSRKVVPVRLLGAFVLG